MLFCHIKLKVLLKNKSLAQMIQKFRGASFLSRFFEELKRYSGQLEIASEKKLESEKSPFEK